MLIPLVHRGHRAVRLQRRHRPRTAAAASRRRRAARAARSRSTGEVPRELGARPARWSPVTCASPTRRSSALGEDWFTIEPWLATEWEQGPMDLTLTLRDDVTFHDGTPFNAEAVKVEHRVRPRQRRPVLRCAQRGRVGRRRRRDHVKINFSRPAPTFLTMLTQQQRPDRQPRGHRRRLDRHDARGHQPVGVRRGRVDRRHEDGLRARPTTTGATRPGSRTSSCTASPMTPRPPPHCCRARSTSRTPRKTRCRRIESCRTADTIDLPGHPQQHRLPRPRARRRLRGRGCAQGAVLRREQHRRTRRSTRGVLETPQQHFLDGEYGYNADIAGYPSTRCQAAAALEAAGEPGHRRRPSPPRRSTSSRSSSSPTA